MMKRVPILLLVGLAFAGFVPVKAALLPVVPQPSSWRPAKTGTLVIPATLTVGGACSAARVLVEDWRLTGGRAEAVSANPLVSVSVDPASGLGVEGYRLTVGETAVSIAAETDTGAYWGTRTLLQLLRRGKPLACGVIEDRPKYRYRGFMLDVARKPYSLAFLRDLVKNMAYYKFNVFHIHLNDDGTDAFVSGYSRFRLECETCPELTAKDGHYTKAAFRAFVKEAAAMGVTVIPEIDTPAHAGAITAVHPEFASEKYGRTHLDLHKPEVAAFVEKLYDEYLGGDDPVFVGPYFHVGTDEYDKREAEAFRAYTDRMLRAAKRYGKTPCAWGALTHAKGTTPVVSEDVVMDLWYNGYYDPKEALVAGYKIVAVPSNFLYLVPTTDYYFDYLDCKRLFYEWEPCVIGDVVLPANHPQLLGGKFALWNDISGNGISEDDTFDRVFPAVQVLSQKMWSGKIPNENWDAFAIFSASAGEAPGLNMSDRLTGPGQTTAPSDKAVGWSQKGGYRVFFELMPEKGRETCVLFDDGYSRVGLYDGRVGFEREGFSFFWDCAPPTGRWSALTFSGTAKGVSLTCDGRDFGLSEGAKGCCTNWCGSGKPAYFPAPRTLHFPLAATTDAKSRVRRFAATTGAERKTSPLEARIAADHAVISSEWRRWGHRIRFDFGGKIITVDEPLETEAPLKGRPWVWRNGRSEEQVADLLQMGHTVVTAEADVAHEELLAYLMKSLAFDAEESLDLGSWCALGTSITWYDAHPGPFRRGYPSRVKDVFDFSGYTNMAMSGVCLHYHLRKDIPIPRFDLYTIEHGINDWGNSVKVGTFENYLNPTGSYTFCKGYRQLIDQIRAVNPKAKIVLCTPRKGWGFGKYLPPRSDLPHKGICLKEYADAVRKIAAYEKLPVADFYAECGEDDELPALSIDRALHPNDAGFARMARTLVPAIRQAYH